MREMCGTLKRVSAPKNFDVRVKARIAAHQPQTAKSPLFAFLKYAAPLGLAIVFLGAVVSNNLYSVDNAAVPQIAASYTEKPQPQQDLPTDTGTTQPFVAQTNGPNADSPNETPTNANVNLNQSLAMRDKNDFGKIFETPKPNPTNGNNGGSRDFASRQSQVIKPPGFNNSNTAIETPANKDKANPSYIKQVLEFIGIRASVSGNGWKVQSVGKNTQAERSEILPNDIIEAINGIKLTEIKQINLINGTKLSIVREGKRMEIELK